MISEPYKTFKYPIMSPEEVKIQEKKILLMQIAMVGALFFGVLIILLLINISASLGSLK